MKNSIKKAVIPAAGLGTRFLPATKVIPKELLPIVDQPTLQYIFEELVGAGVEELILVISKGKESIAGHFQPQQDLQKILEEKGKQDLLDILKKSNFKQKITLVYQENPRGLGHAVLCAKEAIGDEPFFVALGDDLIDATPTCAQQMASLFQKYQKPMVAVQEVPLKEVQKYGIVQPKFVESDPAYFLNSDKNLISLQDLVEKPLPENAPSRFAIVGRYLLTPDIFSILENTQEGAGGEIQLTDALRGLNHKNDLLAYRFSGLRFDAGDKFGFIQANIHYGLKNPEISPSLRTYISECVKTL